MTRIEAANQERECPEAKSVRWQPAREERAGPQSNKRTVFWIGFNHGWICRNNFCFALAVADLGVQICFFARPRRFRDGVRSLDDFDIGTRFALDHVVPFRVDLVPFFLGCDPVYFPGTTSVIAVVIVVVVVGKSDRALGFRFDPFATRCWRRRRAARLERSLRSRYPPSPCRRNLLVERQQESSGNIKKKKSRMTLVAGKHERLEVAETEAELASIVATG